MEALADLRLQLRNVRRFRGVFAIGAIFWLIAVLINPHPFRGVALLLTGVAVVLSTVRIHQLENRIERATR